jgi:hypothetical protein
MDYKLASDPENIFNTVDNSFLSALKHSDETVKYFKIASHYVKIRFAGPELVPYCIPAINHLSVEKSTNISLTISVWDSKSTKINLPFDLWGDHKSIRNNKRNSNDRQEHIRNYFQKKNIRGMYHDETKVLSIFNKKTNKAILWCNSKDSIPYFSTSSPFRSIFHWWSLNMGLLLIHASAVGYNDGGVLIVGKSGSGKSNTALASINSNINFAGDDHVIVDTTLPLKMYSLYNAFKLKKPDIVKYPELVPINNRNDHYKCEKTIFFMDQLAKEKIVNSFEIRSILLPKITNIKSPQLYRIPPSKALLAISPNTIFQLPGSGKIDYEMMVKLVRNTPSYILELGPDVKGIPHIIDKLLKDKNIS